ncbi:serine hydrolase domain-containing protein [Singulisphaera sp. PoT]|uniref:serine hydrolase domain-containing protein n=1 Tax=Singulisphaera sp. PoT TaxID=3411797 RepID=UPI003BF5E04D
MRALRTALVIAMVLAMLGRAGLRAEEPPPAKPIDKEPAPEKRIDKEPPLAKRIDKVLDTAVAEKKLVGAVLIVAKDGQVVYHRAVGLADREANRPMREDDIFRLASMTKTLTSAAALALVDKGKLQLNDPVTKYLPDFRPKLADGKEPTITIHHLLTHTSGLTYGFLETLDGPYHKAKVSDGLDQPGLSLEENLRRIDSVPLSFEPGSAWNYSVSTDVLGAVVASASKMPLPEAIAQLVTEPLKMKETTFYASDPARLVPPYGDGTPQPVRMTDPYSLAFAGTGEIRYAPSRVFDRKSFPSGGGGMIGTARDYITLLEAIRKGGDPILKPETTALMTSNRIGSLSILSTFGPGWGFGYGFAVLKDTEKSLGPHSLRTYQWGGAYGHHWFVDPAEKLTVVLLTNTAIAGMAGAIPYNLTAAIYGEKR